MALSEEWYRQAMADADASWRYLVPPLTRASLDFSDLRLRTVRLSHQLSVAEFQRLATALERRPDIQLQAYGDLVADLDFLQHFPRLRRLRLDLERLDGLDGLAWLSPDLDSLWIESGSPLRLGPLGRFQDLRVLLLHGTFRQLDVVGELSGLDWLMLSSVRTRDLDFLRPLRRLSTLRIRLGGVTDLRALPKIGRLRVLNIEWTRGLADVDPIGEMETLETLFLYGQKQVTRLPSFRRAAALRRVYLEVMRGLTDLTPLADAPGIEALLLIDWRHASPEIVRPFVGHPTLRYADLGFGSLRKNTAAHAILPLPEAPGGMFHVLGPPG